MRHKVQPSQQAAAAAARTMRMTMPRQRATVGRRWHQSIMPCSWLRHSGRYSFIHSLHSAALFLMVFVVIEAIIRNMHSIFMFVIFSLAFFASLRLCVSALPALAFIVAPSPPCTSSFVSHSLSLFLSFSVPHSVHY